jgi:hypothetical protein
MMNSSICSECCGPSRNAKKCEGCPFYKDEKSQRNYGQSPSIALQEMEHNFGHQEYSNIIESALCRVDSDNNLALKDVFFMRLLELLLDKYFFNDSAAAFANPIEQEAFETVDSIIRKEMKKLNNQEISKYLGTIYRSVRRRNTGGRNYIEFIRQYVGVRVAPGVRMMPDF